MIQYKNILRNKDIKVKKRIITKVELGRCDKHPLKSTKIIYCNFVNI